MRSLALAVCAVLSVLALCGGILLGAFPILDLSWGYSSSRPEISSRASAMVSTGVKQAPSLAWNSNACTQRARALLWG